MRALSKSKLLAYRQCPKRLWLEIHHPEWHADSAATQASFNVEHQVGEIAIQVYDPWGKGGILNPKAEGFDVAPKDFMETEYSKEFDMFLFEEIGYPLLTQLTMGLFLTPYGVTSLPEYFAESFEFFFLKDRDYVRKLAPECSKKLIYLKELHKPLPWH